jgi:Pyruvate/2-oxoacid:ferredoxin oxidoreductase delta subunit
MMQDAYATNTLEYDESKCSGCGMCSVVCPHRVFAQSGRVAEMQHYERCMECGACSLNCPAGAIEVESGVGCASALMLAALRGRDDGDACCGPGDDCGDSPSGGGSCCS